MSCSIIPSATANGSANDDTSDQEEYSSDDEEDPENIQISQQSASAKEKPRQSTQSVRGLQIEVEEGKLNPQPFFQRGYVWSHAQASGVIETLLLGNPLPEVMALRNLRCVMNTIILNSECYLLFILFLTNCCILLSSRTIK